MQREKVENEKELLRNFEKAYEKIKFEEFKSCRHIVVCTGTSYDSWEGRRYNSFGCIKCGLDDSVLSAEDRGLRLPYEKSLSYDFFLVNGYRGFQRDNTGVECDLDLAQDIYLKIKEKHPDIDDEIAIIYFKRAIEKIKENNSAKRLSLNI